jgi:hypothetical protein
LKCCYLTMATNLNLMEKSPSDDVLPARSRPWQAGNRVPTTPGCILCF